MRPIQEVAEHALHWKKRGAGRHELLCGDDLVAVLSCEEPYGLLATVRTAQGRWLIQCVNLFESRFMVRSVGQDEDPSTFVLRHDGGTLKLPNGKTFQLLHGNAEEKRSCRRLDWRWTDREGRLCIIYRAPAGGWLGGDRYPSEVYIEPRADASSELGLLACLGWYMAMVRHEDEEAVIAALLIANVVTEALLG